MTLIGLDFSINKPAACINHNGELIFMSWPYELSEKFTKLYSESGVQIIERTDNKDKGDNISTKMRYEVENSKYLANLITQSLLPYLNIDTYIAFEGLSYGSPGDVGIQLGGYKYMLMDALSKYVSLDKMFTYSPITVKSIAGCAKRGMGKGEMINVFSNSGHSCKFRVTLSQYPTLFKNKKGTSWIVHIDDLVDAYWVLETMKVKENLALEN